MTDLPADVIAQPRSFFPSIFVDEIVSSLKRMLDTDLVVARPVVSEDASMSIGVFPAQWSTDEQTYQLGQFEPTENEYIIRVQCIVKATDRAIGRAEFSNLAKLIRVILVRDPELRLRLLQSSEELLSSVERVKGYSVTKQEYLDGPLGSVFMFLATTFVTVSTNTTFQNL